MSLSDHRGPNKTNRSTLRPSSLNFPPTKNKPSGAAIFGRQKSKVADSSTTPLKTNMSPENGLFSREFIFQPLIFRGHVSFQGGNTFSETIRHLKVWAYKYWCFTRGPGGLIQGQICYNQVVLILFGSNFVGFGYWNPTELIYLTELCWSFWLRHNTPFFHVFETKSCPNQADLLVHQRSAESRFPSCLAGWAYRCCVFRVVYTFFLYVYWKPVKMNEYPLKWDHVKRKMIQRKIVQWLC